MKSQFISSGFIQFPSFSFSYFAASLKLKS